MEKNYNNHLLVMLPVIAPGCGSEAVKRQFAGYAGYAIYAGLRAGSAKG